MARATTSRKPWDNTRLVTTLRSQVELGDALRRTRRLSAENERLQTRAPGMVAESRAMKAVLELVDRIAPSDANVLISGEHGTGKEVVARRIHAMSHRAGKPFVPVNAGALSEGVFESELFGHVKGAFTDAKADRTGCFELGDQGTLFMDEVANMPLGQQAKLLRVLQTGEFHPVGSSRVRRADTRVLAATNADLHAGVKSGAFREDLLYRLNTVEVVLPPLRDRREDIPALASAFLAAQAARYRKPVQRFGVAALKALLEYPWPGNVRELEHCVERAVLMARGAELTPEDLVLPPARRRRPGGGHDARGRRALPHPAGARPHRRQRQRRGEAPRALAQRAVPTPPAVRAEGQLTWHSVGPMSGHGSIPHLRAAARAGRAPGDAARAHPRGGARLARAPGGAGAGAAWSSAALVALGGGHRAAAQPADPPAEDAEQPGLGAPRGRLLGPRARDADRDDPLGEVLWEVNALGDQLRTERLGELEASALLGQVLEEIDVAHLRLRRDGRAPAGQPRRGAAAPACTLAAPRT